MISIIKHEKMKKTVIADECNEREIEIKTAFRFLTQV